MINAKAVVLKYLQGHLDVPVVSTRLDDGTPAQVRVISTGGPGRSDRVLQGVQLTIDCYHKTTGLAFTLASQVDDLLYDLPQSSEPINAVPWSSTPAEYPDPDLPKSARCTATYQFTVKT